MVDLFFQTSVNGNVTMVTITGLNPFTNYSCTVHAVTISDGPQSDLAAVTTLEAGMITDHNMMFILW